MCRALKITLAAGRVNSYKKNRAKRLINLKEVIRSTVIDMKMHNHDEASVA
jgi:hypothetical protein